MYISDKIKQDRAKFVEVLFNPHEKIAFGKDNSYANKPRSHQEFIDSVDAEKFCINPVWDRRLTESVSKTSLLFECDDENLTIDEQERLFLESGLPFSTMVSSGSKSIHVILRFTMYFQDKQWSESWWYAIARVLEKKGIIADRRARLVTQLSRVPGTIRSNTGKEQTLITIRERVSHSEVLEWLQKNEEYPIKPKEVVIVDRTDINRDLSMSQKWKIANNWTEKKNRPYIGSAKSGNWNWLFAFGVNSYNLGLSLDGSIGLSQIEFGMTTQGSGGPFPISDAITAGFKWAQKQ